MRDLREMRWQSAIEREAPHLHVRELRVIECTAIECRTGLAWRFESLSYIIMSMSVCIIVLMKT